MSKRDSLGSLINRKAQNPKGSNPAKRELISNPMDMPIDMDSNVASSTAIHKDNNIDTSKLETYRAVVQKKAKKPSANDLRAQQNVYIDKNLIQVINEILKKNKKLQKKDIYDSALQMYLEFAFDKKVTLKEDEYK